MKPNYIYLITAALMLLFSNRSFSQTESEPNNSIATANVVVEGATISGDVGPGDANDYFLGIPNDDGTVTMTVQYANNSGNAGADLFIYMLNEAGAQIGSQTLTNIGLPGTGTGTITVHCRLADTVYFLVNSGFAIDYDLSFNTASTGVADTEPNNAFGEATFFASGNSVDGRIGYLSVARDVDDYYFTVLPDDGTLEVYLDYENTSGASSVDLFHYVYNKSGALIGSSTLTNRPVGLVSRDTITIHCRKADTVYFRVNANECISYSLSYNVIPSGTPDAEPNDNFGQATFFSQGTTMSGRVGYISVARDVNDYYYTSLPDDGTLKVYLNYTNTTGSNGVDMFYGVYNEAHALIGSKSLTNRPLGISTTDTLTIHCRQADTVFFLVDANECISYSLSYEVIPSGAADVEPNNSLPEATFFPSVSSVSGRVGYTSVSTDMNDYYTSLLPDDGTLKVYLNYTNTSGANEVDLYYYVYNKAGAQIGTSSLINRPEGLSTTDTLTIHCRLADTVFFRINANACISYNLSYEVISSGLADAEPNHSFEDATYFHSDSIVNGRVGYRSVGIDGDDYYYSVLPEDGTLKVYLDYKNTSGASSVDLYHYVYNKSAGLIGSSSLTNLPTDFESRDTITVYCRKADTVYFRVNANECVSYTLGYEMVDTEVSEAEPNNSFAEAVHIDLTEVTKGNIGHSSVSFDGNDYFKFYNSGYSSIRWNFSYNNTSGSNGADLYLYAYNPNGSLHSSASLTNRPVGPGVDTSITFNCVPLDTFYLRISASAGCFNYSFDFDLENGTFYKDADSDNYGDPDSSVYSCTGPPPGYIATAEDCDDNNSAINPAAAEVCDGVDNNCDGNIDEGIYTTSTTNAAICEGDSILIGGMYRFTAGTYVDTTIIVNGCDSISTVTLAVNPTDTVYLSSTTTDSSAAGVFETILSNQYGCDSVVITTVTYVPDPCASSDSTFVTNVSCDSAQAGVTVVVLVGSDGCDSVVTTATVYDPGITTNLSDVEICEGDSAMIFGEWEGVAGTYYDTLFNENGCDSILMTTLIVKPDITVFASDSICEGDSLFIGGDYQTSAGVYTDVFIAANGCDSTLITSLTIRDSTNCFIDTGSALVLVSDSSWRKSTVVTTATSNSYPWPGVSTIPAEATFTVPVTVGQPYPWEHLYTVSGSEVITATPGVTYYRSTFELANPVGIEARFRMFVDDDMQIFINGKWIALEDGMGPQNWRTENHDLLFAGGGYINGFMGGDPFDAVTSADLDTVFVAGTNSLVLAIRNRTSKPDYGGFSFRMDLDRGAVAGKKSVGTSVVAAGSLVIFPNPTKNKIMVSIGGVPANVEQSELLLLDLSGRLLERHSMQSEIQLDLSSYSSGVYLLKVTSGTKIYTQKVVKE